jgi:hypothetical protein
VLVIAQGKSILFCREKNIEREIWDGFRYGPEGARERFGFDEAHPVERARSRDGAAAREPAGAALSDGPGSRMGRARHALGERGARARRAPASPRPSACRTCAR